MKLTRLKKDYFYLHENLEESDNIYYLYRYHSGLKYRDQYDNPLILGVKNDEQGCIEKVARNLAIAMKEEKILYQATIVPIPTSKVTAHRTDIIVNLINRQDMASNYNVQSIIKLKRDTRALHKSLERFTVAEIQEAWELEANLRRLHFSDVGHIVIFDDILNHGTHFRVASNLVKERFPLAKLTGVFMAITHRTYPRIRVSR